MQPTTRIRGPSPCTCTTSIGRPCHERPSCCARRDEQGGGDQGAQHHPSILGNDRERNWADTSETARICLGRPSRVKTSWSASGQPTTVQRPSGETAVGSRRLEQARRRVASIDGAGVDVDDPHAPSRVAYASRWPSPGSHTGARSRGAGVEQAVALAVAADDPQFAAREVRDPRVGLRAAPAWEAHVRPRERPAHRLRPASARRARSRATRRRSGRTATTTPRGSRRAAASSRPRRRPTRPSRR